MTLREHGRSLKQQGNPAGSTSLTSNGSLVRVPSVPSCEDQSTADGSLVRDHTLADAAVDRLVTTWGLAADGYFPCPLPGHQGRAFLRGNHRIGCCHGRERSLAEVWAAIAYGADDLRSNIELAVWWRRLAYDLDALEPAPVTLPDLPQDAPPAAKSAREGFALVVGLRRVDRAPRPVAYSVRFTAAWCRLSHGEAASALRVLRDARVIQEVGRAGRVPLYEPGRPRPIGRGDVEAESGQP